MEAEKMAYAIENFYPYFWNKFKFPIKDGTEYECEESVESLREAIWVHRIVSFRHWHPFVEMNLIPMTSSPEMYVSCVFFMISTTIQSLHNRYETFLTTCSLVTAVAAYVYDKGFPEFLDYCPSILTVFFKDLHEEIFRRFNIWDHLQEYLISNNYSEAYDIAEEKTRENPFADVVFEFDFVREIKLKIHSKIPVLEHAAVYHNTKKVMELFGTVAARTKSIDQLAVGENQTLHKVVKGPLRKDGKEPQADGAKEPLHKGARVPQNEKAKGRTKSTSKQSAIGLEDARGSNVFFSELKQILQDFETRTALQREGRISTEDTDNIHLKVSPSKSEEPLQDTAKPRIGKGKETTRMLADENTETTSMKLDLPSISEQSLQDVKMLVTAEIEQSASTHTSCVDEDSSDTSMEQKSSISEQSLPEDVKKRITTETERIATEHAGCTEENEDTSDTSMESNSSSSSESSPPDDKKTPVSTEIEPIASAHTADMGEDGDNAATSMKRKLSFISEQSLPDVKTPVSTEIGQISSVHTAYMVEDEDKAATSMERSTSISEPSLPEDVKKPVATDIGQVVSADAAYMEEKITAVPIMEPISSSISVPSLPEDVKKPVTSEIKPSASVVEETGEIGLKQDSSYQSEEQSLQDDMNKLRLKDCEHSAPLESNIVDTPSDAIRQVEAENLTEECCLDTSLPDDAKDSTPSPKSKNKKKKKRQRSKKPKVTDSPTDLKTDSPIDLKSDSVTDSPTDLKTDSLVPSKEEALNILSTLMTKSANSVKNVHNLLDIEISTDS